MIKVEKPSILVTNSRKSPRNEWLVISPPHHQKISWEVAPKKSSQHVLSSWPYTPRPFFKVTGRIRESPGVTQSKKVNTKNENN